MTPVTQAIIPQLDETIKSSHLHSFAEAFNTRILNGAGDSHWRIPYYIYSAYFRKPRLDNDTLYAPESEFFDFYQFVNPANGDTWPVSSPQTPEGANLQTNFLNRFIFGMNYNKKDPSSGAWLYEREDVRVQKAQNLLRAGESYLFRGRTFNGFTAVGTDNGIGLEYTAFGLANEVHNYGYISGNPTNPAGNSYGGFYGLNPLITKKDGCGEDAEKFYPSSEGSLIPIDEYIGKERTFKICNEGTSADFDAAFTEYSIISNGNLNNFFAFKIRGNNLISAELYPKNKWHLTQNQSTVFLGREQKNHIYRLLYNFITYAKGFDFDWFFNNQYCFAPEIGSFSRITATYSVNNPQLYNRKDLMNSEIQFDQARLVLRNNKLSNSRKLNGTFTQAGYVVTITFTTQHGYNIDDWVDIYLYYSGSSIPFPNDNYNRFKVISKTTLSFNIDTSGMIGSASGTFSGNAEIRTFLYITEGIDYKTIPDSSYIEIKTPTDTVQYNGVNNYVKPYLYNNDYLSTYDLREYLYELRSVTDGAVLSNTIDPNTNDYGQLVTVPNGFTLQSLEVLSTNVKKCTVLVHYTKITVVDKLKFEQTDVKVFNFSPSVDKVALAISSNLYLSTDSNYTCLLRFEVKDITYFNESIDGGIILYPIFLYTYKPKIEDAYALLRACAYYGLEDANFDNPNHPFKIADENNPGAKYFSDQLKKFGSLGGGDIRNFSDKGAHDPNNVDLNTNAIFEASRRLSLFTRILGPNNIQAIVNENTLRFDRFARQSGRLTKFKDQKYLATQSEFTIASRNFLNYQQNFSQGHSMDWWNTNLPYFASLFPSNFYNEEMLPSSTADLEITYPYYSAFDHYVFNAKNETELYTKLDNDIILALGSKGIPSQINANTVQFQPAEFLVNYDSFVVSRPKSVTDTFDNNFYKQINDTSYIYYQFEDKYGEKYFRFDNGGNKVYQVRRFDNFIALPDVPNVIGVGHYEMQDLDNDGFITITNTDRKYYLDGISIFTFKRRPKAIQEIFSLATAGRFFYFIDKNGSFVTRETSATWRYNYSGTIAVKNASLDQKEQGYSYDDYATYLLRIEQPIISDYSSDVKEFILDLTGLMSLANTLYSNYDFNKIILNKETGEIAFNELSAVNFESFIAFAREDYDKYLAGYKLVVSYFENQIPESKQIYDTSKVILNKQEIFTVSVIYGSLEIQIFSGLIGSEFELPKWDSSWSNTVQFKFYVNVNVREKKDTIPSEIVNLPIYLSIKNSIPSNVNPNLTPIIRDGAVLIKRTGNAIDTSQDAPTERDVFQGIAPDINTTLSGSLLIGRQYKVSSGSIIHSGVEYTNGQLFTASNTQYTPNSGTPIITPTNGIMEIAFPSNFSNEWAFWINFLPFSPFNSSIFKREVYGDTNSPFIDRCHVNSDLLPKSAENKHINSGLPRAYAPEAPPSYRYLPLILPNQINYAFQNLAVPLLSDGSNASSSSRQLQEKFYTSCEAFKAPYKIIRAYIDSAHPDSVFIQLNRKIDGYDEASTDSATPGETARTDYNGLKDWLSGTNPSSFRIGDASITNEFGLFQATSVTSNQYLGSYYPRFFFVKLIPRPYSDKNVDGQLSDSPTNHEMIKQAELYLEAMREGFTANSQGATGRLSCENIKGHLTPPDLKYDQLFMNATTFSGVGTSIRGWYGNKYPSLLPSSLNFNLRATSIIDGYRFGRSSVKRYEDNPRGFGAVPYVATYLESYASIAKSINSLLYFRVPFPLDYEETLRSYNSDEVFPPVATPQTYGNSESTFSDQAGPTDVANIKNGISYNDGQGNYAIYNKVTDATYSLRELNGSLRGSSAGQGYAISGIVGVNGVISFPRILKFYQEVDLKLIGIDSKLKTIAYKNVEKLLSENPSSFATISSSRSSTTIRPTKADDSFYHGSNIKSEAFTVDDIISNSDPICGPGISTQLIPPSLLPSPLFYNYKRNASILPGLWTRSSYSNSSLGVSLIETGFQIIKLEIQTPAIIVN